MWHFDYSIPTVIVEVFVIILFFMRKRLPIRLSREFVVLIGVDLLATLLDYASSLMDDCWQDYTMPELTIVNGLFFLLFIGRSFTFYKFTAILCGEWRRSPGMRLFTMYLPMAALGVMVIASPFTGWIFTVTETGYASGPFYPIIDLQFLYTCAMMALLLFRAKKRFPELRRTTGWICVSLLVTGVIVRMAVPTEITINMFCLLAIMLIFFGYLNPGSFLDSELEVFNAAG